MKYEMSMEDREHCLLMARVANKLGVRCPSPGAGLQVASVIETIEAAVAQVKDPAVAQALGFYLATLMFAAGVWAYQQQMVIEDAEAALKRATEQPNG